MQAVEDVAARRCVPAHVSATRQLVGYLPGVAYINRLVLSPVAERIAQLAKSIDRTRDEVARVAGASAAQCVEQLCCRLAHPRDVGSHALELGLVASASSGLHLCAVSLDRLKTIQLVFAQWLEIEIRHQRKNSL